MNAQNEAGVYSGTLVSAAEEDNHHITTQTNLQSTSRERGRGRKDRGFMLPLA